VSRWARVTPASFRFTAKFPKSITHDKRLGQGVESDLEYFYKAMTPLADKLGCLLLQLPPSMTMKEGLKKLQTLPLDKRFRYAIEPRQESWFDGEVYSFLHKNDFYLAWTQQKKIQTPPVVTTDFIYLRFIGNRSINEKDFGVIHKNREKELQNSAGVIKKTRRSDLQVSPVCGEPWYHQSIGRDWFRC
jgi:uncharacterized protein YecE (DUF72 family)